MESAASNGQADRPRVGLALGGGVARGMAHIGVLSVLEEAGIPIDVVAGTSMGAIVGAAYCAGLSIAELRDIAADTGWQRVSGLLPSPRGLLTFAKLERWLEDTLGSFDVRDLAIPFAAVASDLISSERVVLWKGRLCTAVHASCAVPGVVSPVEIDGRYLVDGGVTDNVPADVARMLGGDYIIGVDVFVASMRHYLGPLGPAVTAVETLVRHAGDGTMECDCLIVPQLQGESYVRFADYEKFIARGEEAARQMLPVIRAALARPASDFPRMADVADLEQLPRRQQLQVEL